MNSPRRLKVTDLSEHKKSKNSTVVMASDANSETELEFTTSTKTAPRHGQIITLNISWED